jgi:ribosomal protein L37AE/L43A
VSSGVHSQPPSAAMKYLPAAIERPVCKKCGTRMMLARISPEGDGFETHLFECPKCERILVERVASDPMELCKGWLTSELKPPE